MMTPEGIAPYHDVDMDSRSSGKRKERRHGVVTPAGKDSSHQEKSNTDKTLQSQESKDDRTNKEKVKGRDKKEPHHIVQKPRIGEKQQPGFQKETPVKEGKDQEQRSNNNGENRSNTEADSSIDRSESSYDEPWQSVNKKKPETKEAIKETPSNNQRISFDSQLPTHRSIGGGKADRTLTSKPLTETEVKQKCEKMPKRISKHILEEDEGTLKMIHYLTFKLFTSRKITHSGLLQILYDRILIHDESAAIKPYITKSFLGDNTANLKIEDQCWRKRLSRPTSLTSGQRRKRQCKTITPTPSTAK